MFVMTQREAKVTKVELRESIRSEKGTETRVRIHLALEELTTLEVKRLPGYARAGVGLQKDGQALVDIEGPHSATLTMRVSGTYDYHLLVADADIAHFAGRIGTRPALKVVEGKALLVWNVDAEVPAAMLEALGSWLDSDQTALTVRIASETPEGQKEMPGLTGTDEG